MRSRWLVSAMFGVGLFASGLLACAALLGIDEERPLRKADTGPEAAVDAGDAGAACDPNGPSELHGCALSCPHDFCADFDVEGQEAGLGWSATNSGLINPFTKAESGVEVVPPGISPPQWLHVVAGSPTGSAFGMLGQQLKFAEHHTGQTFEGIRTTIDVKIDNLVFTEIAGSPIPDAGSAAVLGLLRPGITSKPKGVALLVTERTFFISVSEDVLGGEGQNVQADLGVKLTLQSGALNNAVRVELFVGTYDSAVALSFPCAQPPDNGLVAAARVGAGTLGKACVAIPPNFDTPVGETPWAESPILLVGGLLFAAGRVELRSDNVVADFNPRPK